MSLGSKVQKKSGWEQKKGGSKKTTLGLDTAASKVSILEVVVLLGDGRDIPTDQVSQLKICLYLKTILL